MVDFDHSEHSDVIIIVSQTKGVKWRSKDVTGTQQQKLESPTVVLGWHASKYKLHKLHYV